MSWLKNVILDVAVAVVVIIFVVTGHEWSRWVILIYTPLMLLMKIGAVWGAGAVKPITGQKKKTNNAPSWFFHILYAGTVALFVYSQWWLMAGAWLVIWIASVAYMLRARPARSDA
ncbi:MAG: hypothetical protein HKN13_09800 [Rhodothermales bacterium]|nr:hypothetical protein [Rhodothermales bacterium]